MSKFEIINQVSVGAAAALILYLTPYAVQYPAAGIVVIVLMVYGILWLYVNSPED